MATLEDKLMGVNLDYSSGSEDDERNDVAEKMLSNDKRANDGCVTDDVVPPIIAGNHSQGSTNTGPKGVMKDWQNFKELQAERREKSELKRLELVKKSTLSTSTTNEDLVQQRQEDLDAELAELMSEDFLQRFQKQRIVEMLQQCGHTQKFGEVRHLKSREDFLECVEHENKHVTVIVHIYHRSVNACTVLNACLDKLAVEYPSTAFARICTSVAGMSYEFRSKGLPALLVYKDHTLIGNFVHVTDNLPEEFFATDIENFLIGNCILVDKQIFN